MCRFLPQLWHDFKANNHGDFWAEFNRLEERLYRSLDSFINLPPEERDPKELSILWESTHEWVQLNMAFDPLARNESYTLKQVPFPQSVYKFMHYARTQSSLYCEVVMNRYWHLNSREK